MIRVVASPAPTAEAALFAAFVLTLVRLEGAPSPLLGALTSRRGTSRGNRPLCSFALAQPLTAVLVGSSPAPVREVMGSCHNPQFTQPIGVIKVYVACSIWCAQAGFANAPAIFSFVAVSVRFIESAVTEM
jgi:hypothetical protein